MADPGAPRFAPAGGKTRVRYGVPDPSLAVGRPASSLAYRWIGLDEA